MPFFKQELEDIFAKFDPANIHDDVLNQLQAKCDLEQMQEDDIKRAIQQVSLNVKDMIFKSKIL